MKVLTSWKSRTTATVVSDPLSLMTLNRRITTSQPRALQVLEQGNPDTLADTSLALDVKDRQENAFVGQRNDVNLVHGDNIEALQVAV
jgi:hypothetical protein